jgi:hypothetical protein
LSSKKTTPAQIDIWRAAKSETEHLEFKEARNQFDFERLLAYCVAIANERGGLLLLGIANKPPRPVVGTSAYPNIVKTTEDLFSKLKFRVDVEEVQHPGGRVLVFHIPSRPTGHPHHLDGTYLMRSGESLVAMSADQLQKIFGERPSGRPTLAYIISALILGLVILIVMNYWPSRNPRTHDAEIKADSTGHESKEESKNRSSKPEAKAEGKPKDVPPRVINPSKSQADVEALLVVPKNLSMAAKNTSTEIAWDIKYEAILWNLDEARNQTQETVRAGTSTIKAASGSISGSTTLTITKR